MKKMLLLTTVIIIVIVACTHKSQLSPSMLANGNTHQTTLPDTTGTTTYLQDTSVCFQRDVLPIFLGSCAKSGCHDAITQKDGYNFTSYSSIVAKGITRYNSGGSKVYTKCVSGKMPKSPTPALDSMQLSFIRRWIDMGAPNDTDCPVNCDTTSSYSHGVQPILQKYCYSCHATSVAAASGGNHPLDTYSGLLVQAQNGNLIGDLTFATGHNSMPQGGSRLPACMIDQVHAWIAAGAPNN